MNELRDRFDWRGALREQRRKRGLSQPEVARRAGLSLSAVKAYETGDRHPSPETLAAIIDALGIPVEDANPIRAGAGYAIDWETILNARYAPRDAAELAAEVEAYGWPVFVTNQATDILCANRAFRALVGIDASVRLPDKQRWNLLARASDPAFAERMLSWDETMAFMLGIAKADPRYDVNLERPTPFLAEPLRRFLEGDPAYIRRLLELWEQSPPQTHRTRMHYPVVWRLDAATVLRFDAMIHPADIWQELSWHDWVPADAAAWEGLVSLSGGRR